MNDRADDYGLIHIIATRSGWGSENQHGATEGPNAGSDAGPPPAEVPQQQQQVISAHISGEVQDAPDPPQSARKSKKRQAVERADSPSEEESGHPAPGAVNEPPDIMAVQTEEERIRAALGNFSDPDGDGRCDQRMMDAILAAVGRRAPCKPVHASSRATHPGAV